MDNSISFKTFIKPLFIKTFFIKTTLFTSLYTKNLVNSEQLKIDYTLIDGAEQILTHFDPLNADGVLSHGCWCAKLLRKNSGKLTLGGSSSTDELDDICRQWIKARKCSEQSHGCKNFVDAEDLYEIDFTSDLSSATCPDSDTCLSESCQIDVSFVGKIRDLQGVFAKICAKRPKMAKNG